MGRLRGANVVGAVYLLTELGRGPRHRLDLVLPGRAALRRVARQVHHGVRRGECEERRHDHRPIDRRVVLLDPVPELGAEPGRLGERAQALRLDLRAVRRQARERDAQRARIGADFLPVGSSRRGRDVGVARARTARRVEQRRGVSHGQGHRVLHRAASEPFAQHRRHRVAAARGLEADDAAARRRRADRAEAVGRVRHREHARSHGRGRAAARAAGDARGIPRIARRTVQPGLAREREPELARVGATEDDETGALEPRDVLAVGRGWRRVGEELRASRHRHARDRGREVLHEKRHAGERSVGQTRGDRRARVVVERHRHRVDRAVARLHALDGGLEELGGTDLPAADEVGQTSRVGLLVVDE